MKKAIQFLSFLCLVVLFLSACNLTRSLKEGEYLVNKNTIVSDNKLVKTDEASDFIKQKPNRRILGMFRFHLAVYNYAAKGGITSKTDSFLVDIGEPPVILDTLLTEKSVKQIKLYLFSKGYFDATVNDEIVRKKKKKKANITYLITSGTPYKINKIEYEVDDPAVRNLIISDSVNSLLKSHVVYDADVLQSERERVETFMKNDGYFRFSRELIKYRVDSTLGSHEMDITIEVKNPSFGIVGFKDSIVSYAHKRYKYNQISIYSNFNSLALDTSGYKKIVFIANKGIKNKEESEYIFIFSDKMRINPKIITQAVFYKKGDYYNLKNVERTYSNLMDLKMYKFVNVQFFEADLDSTSNLYLLNSKVFLTPTPVQSYSIETEATNSSGNLGIAGNLIYQNKNIFRGAEIFNFKIKGAMEVQSVLGGAEDESGIQSYLPFNTIETGAEAGIDIPRFLLPINQEVFSKSFRPKTFIKMGVQYQKRPDYTRYIINGTYGFEWKENVSKKHTVYLADINSVKIYPTELFEQIINGFNDPKIQNSYKDHMTLAGRYSFLYNNQQINKSRDFDYFKGEFETSGFIMRGINKLLNNYNFSDGSYMLFYQKYAQYIKTSIDYRHYFVFPNSNKLVARGLAGYGLAYANSTVLPFEKSFFAGGSNSVRAWSIYSLGPGSFNDEQTVMLNRTGDIDIEGNLEYRFPIYSFFNGAFFMDAGNIWLNKKNELMQGAEFKIDRFYKEFALGAGFGARFDFSFFIMRLDMAYPLRDPSKAEGYRWVAGKFDMKRVNFNLGIGYPF